MKENRGFTTVKVTKQKLRDVALIINECKTAYEKAIEDCSCLDSGVYQTLTLKQRHELRVRRNHHIINFLVGECDEVLDRLDSWGYIDMNEIIRENNKLFDETRHSHNATATHLVCYRDQYGTVGIVEQFASKTEAQQFIDTNGYGFIVEI